MIEHFGMATLYLDVQELLALVTTKLASDADPECPTELRTYAGGLGSGDQHP